MDDIEIKDDDIGVLNKTDTMNEFILPPLKRFVKNPYTGSYQKRIIIGDSVYRLDITEEEWGLRNANLISKWIIRNSDSLKTKFRWGKITKENGVHPSMIIENRCEYCNRQFDSHKQKLRHMKTQSCMSIENKDKDKYTTTEKFTDSLDTTVNIRDIQPPINPDTLINVREQNNNIYIQNNIQIREFGNENPKWLTGHLINQVIGNIEKAIPKLMEKKHFNDDFPENRNIRLSNIRDINKRMQVFENGRWRVRDSKQTFYKVLVEMYDVICDALSNDAIDDDDTCVSEEIRNLHKSERFLKKIERIRPLWEAFEKKIQDEDKEIMDDYWEDLKTLLLDRQLSIEQGFD